MESAASSRKAVARRACRARRAPVCTTSATSSPSGRGDFFPGAAGPRPGGRRPAPAQAVGVEPRAPRAAPRARRTRPRRVRGRRGDVEGSSATVSRTAPAISSMASAASAAVAPPRRGEPSQLRRGAAGGPRPGLGAVRQAGGRALARRPARRAGPSSRRAPAARWGRRLRGFGGSGRPPALQARWSVGPPYRTPGLRAARPEAREGAGRRHAGRRWRRGGAGTLAAEAVGGGVGTTSARGRGNDISAS